MTFAQPPEGTPGGGVPGEHKKRPRRRRRGRTGKDEARPERGGPPAADTRRGLHPPAAPVVPPVSRLAESDTAGELLSAAEVAEMKEHLAYLRAYKDALRLRLNAAEDLLVNGRREPGDRGVCRHLLGKVDRAVVEAAVGREPLRSDPAARARMLAGAIRLTADAGVLLAYLETLSHVRSRAEAAQAFAEVVQRIDFEGLSATRLARLLQVLTETFTGQERIQVLFSLLSQPAFRRAFDAAESSLPPDVAEIFAPLRAVHRFLLDEAPEGAGPEGMAGRVSQRTHDSEGLLTAGMEQVLSAPDPVLRGYPEALRMRMLEVALRPGVPTALADRAAGVLLSSLAHHSRAYKRLAIRRVAQLLQRHTDDRARAVLEDIRRADPGYRLAERWLAALDARRLGRVALRGEEPASGRLASGFWLDGQRPVWVRTASADAASRLAEEARLQLTLALPGVAPVVEHGMSGGIAYVAVAGAGQPMAADATRGMEPDVAFQFTAAVVRVLRALALAGVGLPDVAEERFLHSSQVPSHVVLADLDGARELGPASAAEQHLSLARVFAGHLLAAGVTRRLPAEIGEPVAQALATADDLVRLIGALDRAGAHMGRE